MSFKDTKLLIEKNRTSYCPKRIPIVKGGVVYREKNPRLDFVSISRLIRFINGFQNKYGTPRLTIHIVYPRVTVVDKLTIQVLECLIYSMIVDYKYTVFIDIDLVKQIHSEGFAYTPLRNLSNSYYRPDIFITEFENNTQQNHYRKVVPTTWTYNEELSKYLFPDLAQTLHYHIDDEEFVFKLTEVITELVNNANEHNQSDCLVDLDISGEYSKINDRDDNKYIGVNVSIISFSKKSVSEDLSNKISTGQYQGDRYRIVAEAYEKHKQFFSDEYGQRDFFMTTAFQDKISGRGKDHDTSGGTGLTKLLQSLEAYSDVSECYMVSYDRTMYFFENLLDYDDNGFVGFNSVNDYHNKPPDKEVFQTSPIIIPGIAYNLNFVYKKG